MLPRKLPELEPAGDAVSIARNLQIIGNTINHYGSSASQVAFLPNYEASQAAGIFSRFPLASKPCVPVCVAKPLHCEPAVDITGLLLRRVGWPRPAPEGPSTPSKRPAFATLSRSDQKCKRGSCIVMYRWMALGF